MKILKIPSIFLLLTALLFSCKKEHSFESVKTSAGAWQFNDDTKFYAGNIDTAYIETAGTTKTLNLIGKSLDGKQNFILHLYATDTFTVGAYKASLFKSDFQYYTQAENIYQADKFIGEFIVTISTISKNSITGTFSGAAVNSSSAVRHLTLGKFTSRINFLPGTTVTDYFPTTVGSNWAYGKNGGTPADSLLIKVIPYQLTVGVNTFSTFTIDYIPGVGNPDSLYFRRSAGDYYEYFNTEEFFGFDEPGTPPYVEFIFLKDNVPQGTTWNSPNFVGSSAGISSTMFIKMTLFEKATTPVTSGNVTSSDVLKVKYEYLLTTAPATPFYVEERWFAKNIGLIYDSFNDGTKTNIYNIGRFRIF
ncbi:MAG: hypothetical protein ACR2KX_00130 [Chitinophagaceae bacterium]